MASVAQSGLDPVLMPTGGPLDATLMAARICAEHHAPLIVVAGGDGTVNGVLNGLTPGKAILGVIPLGTANVLARELKIHSIDDALRRVARGNSRAVTVGEVACGQEKRRFLLMVGAGVDGAVVKGVRLSDKRAFGKGAYLLSALRVLFAWDSAQLQVASAARSLSCHSVIVCNAGKYGGNFLLAPKADIFAPSFQVICIKGGRCGYLMALLHLAIGRFSVDSHVESFQATELEVLGGKPSQVDGDFFGCGPLRIKSIPGLVRLIV
jgi:diacylglycerol kinase family enzyme